MQKFKVQITDQAIADMDRIYEYVAKKLKAPQNARDQYKRMANAILSLDKLPERFVMVLINMLGCSTKAIHLL